MEHSYITVQYRLLLTPRPSTDSIELLPFSSLFEGFADELESNIYRTQNTNIKFANEHYWRTVNPLLSPWGTGGGGLFISSPFEEARWGGELIETGTYLRSRINTHTVFQSLLTNTVYNLLRRIIRGGDGGGGIMEREGLLNIVLLRDLSENSGGKGGWEF